MTKKDKESSQRMFFMTSSPLAEIVPTSMNVSALSQTLIDLLIASLEQPGLSERLSDGAFYSAFAIVAISSCQRSLD